MPAYGDLVHQTTTSTGTGALTLAAVNGKRTFASALGSGGTNTFDYYVSSRDAVEWERGTGHESAGTLVRDTVIASSNANAAVNFSAGVKDVTNDQPAGERVNKSNGVFTGPLTSDVFQCTRNADYTSGDLNAVNSTSWLNGTTMTNAPTAGWWFVETQRHTNANGYLTQRATQLDTDSGRVFMRHCTSNVWGGWRDVGIIVYSDTAPALAVSNSRWFDTVGCQLYVYFGSVWVAANSG